MTTKLTKLTKLMLAKERRRTETKARVTNKLTEAETSSSRTRIALKRPSRRHKQLYVCDLTSLARVVGA